MISKYGCWLCYIEWVVWKARLGWSPRLKVIIIIIIIIRIITNSSRFDTCRPLFKQLWVLPLPSQYIFSILLFVIKNKKLFQLNSQVHNIHTQFNNNFHFSSTGLTLVQKGVTYSGCKIYNLPPQIKKISTNVALFKTTLKKFLLQYVFCSVDEYYQQNYNDYDC